MDLICNELSFNPLAENSQEALDRFKTVLKTFKAAKKRYNFSHVRFEANYSTQKITKDQTFYEWINTIANHTIKNLILDLFRRPFSDDLTENELENYVENNYEINHSDVPTKTSPLGLPIAFLKSTIALSINSHVFWQNRRIPLKKNTENDAEKLDCHAFNICQEQDLDSEEIQEWADTCFTSTIKSIDDLNRYLHFDKFSSEYADDFMTELLDWKKKDLEKYRYLLLLMKDVQAHPFTGGMGQTENLRNRGKEASKRITQGDRLSYVVENDVVTFISCSGHYNFH